MVNYSYSRELRLLTPANFQKVFKNPLRAGSPQLTILACPNDLDHPRLGLVIPKKQLKLAVDRNQVKRVIRDNFRLKQHNLQSLDYVIIAKGGIGKLTNDELNKLTNKLWKKIARRYKEQQQR
ncbi:ribonuclease P protein component [Psychrobium sp. 1_MG-2023]|uniref:ribonuclease P protein component n=1 Tax=Psychrobium sp. 1_MG-2023 TaxID=3062624 RepID=UPI000C33192F|nr:ribonuclease P protein component [Psychrobium sp. 1_MG-2023]MDP2560507.1 ribonuclease P protein component [Psychrobium sp. 1_MG-2023]PKF55203.1 ribonuclease P protein component [Alteromonadales bacterium alter-6D02]